MGSGDETSNPGYYIFRSQKRLTIVSNSIVAVYHNNYDKPLYAYRYATYVNALKYANYYVNLCMPAYALRIYAYDNLCTYECVYWKPASTEAQNWLGK